MFLNYLTNNHFPLDNYHSHYNLLCHIIHTYKLNHSHHTVWIIFNNLIIKLTKCIFIFYLAIFKLNILITFNNKDKKSSLNPSNNIKSNPHLIIRYLQK